MYNSESASDAFDRLTASIDAATLDPATWETVCDALASLVGARGTLIMPEECARRSLQVPHSPSLGETVHRFMDEGWYLRDFRSRGFPKAVAVGYVTDQDLITEEEMSRHPYYAEFLAPLGLKWFLGVAVEVNGVVWGAAVHASPDQGPFTPDQVELLMAVRPYLERGIAQAGALGNSRINTVKQIFSAADRGLLAVDRLGKIVHMNDRAETILGDVAAGWALRENFGERFKSIVSSALSAPEPTVSRPLMLAGREDRLYICHVIPMVRDFQSLLSGVHALVTLHQVAAETPGATAVMRERFGLTRREAELASLLASGKSVAGASKSMGVSVATARQQAKSVLRKTGTHRQAELVALLNQRPSF